MTALRFARWLERALFNIGIWPLDGYVIFGSAVMKLYDLKDEIGDVDVFVSQHSYAKLRKNPRWTEQRPRRDDPPFLAARYGDMDFHAFYAWTFREPLIDAPECFARAHRKDGVIAIPLELVAEQKAYSVRLHGAEGRWAKHRTDLDTINAYIAGGLAS